MSTRKLLLDDGSSLFPWGYLIRDRPHLPLPAPTEHT
jgi:hypothetical protein